MTEVYYNECLLATFSDENDAFAYISWKKYQIMKDFSQKQLNDYIREQPYTKYGTRTLPGDVPLNELYPVYSDECDRVEKAFVIKDSDKKEISDIESADSQLNEENLFFKRKGR